MKSEFQRWNLKKERKAIASCQLIGGVALLFGLEWNIMLVLSSSFLGVMMLVAIVDILPHQSHKDNISDILPAFDYR